MKFHFAFKYISKQYLFNIYTNLYETNDLFQNTNTYFSLKLCNAQLECLNMYAIVSSCLNIYAIVSSNIFAITLNKMDLNVVRNVIHTLWRIYAWGRCANNGPRYGCRLRKAVIRGSLSHRSETVGSGRSFVYGGVVVFPYFCSLRSSVMVECIYKSDLSKYWAVVRNTHWHILTSEFYTYIFTFLL